METHTKNRCDYCDIAFPNQTSLVEHYLSRFCEKNRPEKPLPTYNPTTHKVVPVDAVVLDPKWIVSHSQSNGGGPEFFEIYTLKRPIVDPTPLPEPKGFGAVVEAGWNSTAVARGYENSRFLWIRIVTVGARGERKEVWQNPDGYEAPWCELINPIIKSEGVE